MHLDDAMRIFREEVGGVRFGREPSLGADVRFGFRSSPESETALGHLRQAEKNAKLAVAKMKTCVKEIKQTMAGNSYEREYRGIMFESEEILEKVTSLHKSIGWTIDYVSKPNMPGW